MKDPAGRQYSIRLRFIQNIAIAFTLTACGGDGGGGGGGMTCSPPPQIRSTPPTIAAVGQQYSYAVDAVHECGDVVPFVCGDFNVLQMPPGTVVDMYSKLITWIPSAPQLNTNVPFAIATVPDACGNSATQSWTVRVLSEIITPSVTSVYPVNASNNVPLNVLIGVLFSEPVNPQTVTTASFLVAGPSGPIAGNVQTSGNQVTFTPNGYLPPSAAINITVTGAVKDLAGNAMASNYHWVFTTGSAPDLTPPTVPANLSAIHITGSSVDLSWNGSVDDFAVAGYKIYRNGVYLQTTTGTSLVDTTPTLDSLYCYQVSSIDLSANESTKSIQACASTAQPFVVADLGYNLGTVGFPGRTSLALDSNLKAHIAFYDRVNNSLYYATNAAGWATSLIDSGVSGYPSLAVDGLNGVHIAYAGAGIYSLRYATNESGSWLVSTVDSNWVGLSPSLALDPAGKAHISYYDYQNGNLKYATNASGSWLVNTIDAGPAVGSSSSLALDSAGNAHIVYYDAFNGDLRYATNASGSWQVSTIDSAGDVGSNSSLVIDATDKLHIAYYDATNRSLKYATNKSGTWMTSVIDAGGGGWIPSLAVDSAGNIYISYADWGYSALKYATNSFGIWKIFVLVSSPNAAGASSIKLDPTGRIHMSSQQATLIIYSVY